jgi:predicted DNA binding CopG/RHH family protein
MIKLSSKVTVPNIKIKVPDKRLWNVIGDDVILAVEDRTQRGKDADRRGFKPYTKEYAKRKGKTKVDLTVTGHMLGKMRNKPSKRGVKVQIAGGIDGLKAWSINFGQKRRFMAINNRDIKKIVKRITKWIAKRNK